MNFYQITQLFSKALEDEDFEAAAQLLRRTSLSYTLDILGSVDNSLEPSVHLFLEYWCRVENTPLQHQATATYLLIFYNYKPGAYTLAYWHLIWAFDLDPSNINILTGLFKMYHWPDGFVSNKTLAPYAWKLLKTNPTDEDVIEAIHHVIDNQ